MKNYSIGAERHSSDLLERSIEALEKFSKSYSPNNHPCPQIYLGICYERLSEVKDRRKNLKVAIKHFNDALKNYKINNSRYDYALIQMHLGNSYGDLSSVEDDKMNILKSSIDCYCNALKVYILMSSVMITL